MIDLNDETQKRIERILERLESPSIEDIVELLDITPEELAKLRKGGKCLDEADAWSTAVAQREARRKAGPRLQ